MKLTFIFMLLACLVFSCSPLKEATSPEVELPSLAAIGKKDKSLLKTDFRQVGEPVFSEKIEVSATAMPFTKSKFKTYQKIKAQRGQKVSINYVDSLPVKPKFLRFEVKDKIGLKTLLNSDKNAQVRSYLTKDADCQIVSSICLNMDEMEADMYLRAEGLFLATDNNGMLKMELINGNQRQLVNFSKNEIFDYETLGFCWGENVYGKPRIETLNNGRCPEGTKKDAQKLEDSFSFLKL